MMEEQQQQNLKREIASKSKLLKEREEEIALLTENETQMEREMKRLQTERKREVEENETWKREERKMKAELAQTHVTQRELLDRLEQKNSEIREKSELVETYLRKIEAYAREKSETEQSGRDLGQKVKTAESARLRAEKEKSLTEEHNIKLGVLPRHVGGELALLGWLRFSNDDIGGAATCMLECLRLRAVEWNAAAVLGQIVEERMGFSDVPGTISCRRCCLTT